MKHFQIEPWEHLRKDSAIFSCLSNLVSYRFSQREVLGPTLATDTCKKTLDILAIPWFSSRLLLRSFAVFAEAASFRCLVKAENQLGWSRRPDLTHPFVLPNEVWERKKKWDYMNESAPRSWETKCYGGAMYGHYYFYKAISEAKTWISAWLLQQEQCPSPLPKARVSFLWSSENGNRLV